LALSVVEGAIGRQVSELAPKVQSVQRSILVQMGQDSVAGVLQFLSQLSGRESGGTAVDQFTNGRRQTAVLGKPDALVVPEALPAKPGCLGVCVPLAVMGVTPEVPHAFESATYRDEGASQSMPQFGEHPAGVTTEQLFQTLDGGSVRRHRRE